MNTKEETLNIDDHSGKELVVSSIIAVVLAAVILVTIVLPVEYDLDPTGVGAALGLTVLANPSTRPDDNSTDVTAAIVAGSESLEIQDLSIPDPLDKPKVSTDAKKFVSSQPTVFRSEVIEINIKADQELEYKFQMNKGQMLLYTWNSADVDLYYEFHAEPIKGEYPKGYYMSYEIGNRSRGGNGTLTAPFTGDHGWYFLNLTKRPVTIKLEVSGYYQSHKRLF